MMPGPHHDGSPLYVSNPTPGLGERVAVFVRVPHAADVTHVALRSTRDTEPYLVEAAPDRADDHETWWRADLEIRSPVTGYRFLLDGGPSGYRWLTGAGVVEGDVTDGSDFRLVSFDPPPAWVPDAVVYQVFPDRFASSGAGRRLPPWAIPSAWEEAPRLYGDEAMTQLYGGDLPGVEAHLEHVERLGANALYLTPFFPGESNHRYNASSFDEVDPVLGGDAALASLVSAAHERGMHVLGDLTVNHCGSTHPWFRAAVENPQSVEADFFFRAGTGFEYWQGVSTLPKFDHRSPELRHRLYEGPDSVAARWLRPPFELDGWRIDVANMAGRLRDVDVNHELATSLRRTIDETRPGSYLLAEHNHDASPDLLGDGWHGTMSYAGFTRPVWRWLGDPAWERDPDYVETPPVRPGLGGVEAAATIDRFRASVPWRSFAHSLTLLGSHDTARWRSVAGSAGRALVGAGLLLTFPGVPCVFQGDEVGVEGLDRHTARRTMPWDGERWDRELLDGYRRLVRLRREHPALRGGGFRWVHVDAGALVYLRETADERILIQASRAAHPSVAIDAGAFGLDAGGGALIGGEDLVPDAGRVRLSNDGPAFRAWSV